MIEISREVLFYYKVYLKAGIIDVLYLYNFKLEQMIFIYK